MLNLKLEHKDSEDKHTMAVSIHSTKYALTVINLCMYIQESIHAYIKQENQLHVIYKFIYIQLSCLQVAHLFYRL